MSYKKVEEIKAYVQDLLQNGGKVHKAEKFSRILARKGVEGERIITWSADAQGNELLEKDAVVTSDENGETGWVCTKLTEDGEILIDANDHKNEWIIAHQTFIVKYVEVPEQPGIYKPAGGPQDFLELTEAITLQQWGSEMSIDAGGFLNITNPDDIYGISKRDFFETYQILA